MRLLSLVSCFPGFCQLPVFQDLTRSPAAPKHRFLPKARRLTARLTEVFTQHPWLLRSPTQASQELSAKYHTKLQQRPHQHLLLASVPRHCQSVSLRVHKYKSSSGSHTTAAGLVGKRELMLCSLSQLSQAGEHQHSV